MLQLERNQHRRLSFEHGRSWRTGSHVIPSGSAGCAFPFTFTDRASATITSGFLPGAVNDLRLIINNTGTASPSAATRTFQSSGDFTYAQLSGTITYSIPEPGGLSLVAIAALAAMRDDGDTIQADNPDSTASTLDGDHSVPCGKIGKEKTLLNTHVTAENPARPSPQ